MKRRGVARIWPSLRVLPEQRPRWRNKPMPAAPKPEWPHAPDLFRKNFDEDPTRQHAKDYSPSAE
jgi:hypothetical protein